MRKKLETFLVYILTILVARGKTVKLPLLRTPSVLQHYFYSNHNQRDRFWYFLLSMVYFVAEIEKRMNLKKMI